MVMIIDTTLRDAHQSLIATRMRTEDMIPILGKLDEVGFYSLECWGGATFDACIRYLAEDPWERLRIIKANVKKTRLQMLLRGRNLLGYRHYGKDIIKKFIPLCVKNGIDIIRIFDALNDINNLELPIKVAKDSHAIVQGAISYTISEVHTIDMFTDLAIQLEKLGCDVICIKDMSGIISPQAAFDLVTVLKKAVRVPINLHTHCTSGMGSISYFAACQAGVDIVDCAFSPFAGGASQPPLESFVASLKNTKFDTGFDLAKLIEIGKYFLSVKEKYGSLCSPIAERSDVSVLIHQVPGGMISNLYSQLKEQKALDKYQEVLEEIPKVRAELGYPPLVTPTSQIVGTQAVLNIIMGERYKKVSEEVKNYCLGLYGRPTIPISSEILQKIFGDQSPGSLPPTDPIESELDKITLEIQRENIPIRSEEDLMTYAMYPQIAGKFLRGEIEPEKITLPPIEKISTTNIPTPQEFIISVDDEEFRVSIRPTMFSTVSKETKEKETTSKPKVIPKKGAIISPMQGMIVLIKKKIGDYVKVGEPVLVLEAMKMQNEIQSDVEGTVKEIYAFETEIVDSGDVLMLIE
ncbi:MAG: pyruvate/oxaloacetate carboxyltransferase [Candidatus Atribacteria bacterium]|nr:pyruvate/oxaloacetate carboxyltransferase [Candidatus Atribacteria bacterium]